MKKFFVFFAVIFFSLICYSDNFYCYFGRHMNEFKRYAYTDGKDFYYACACCKLRYKNIIISKKLYEIN